MSKTYTGLLNGVNDWLARTDLAGQVPNFIKLAEDRINRALRIRDMERGYSEFTSGGGTIDVPEDYIEAKDFFCTVPDEGQIVVANNALVIPLGVGGSVNVAGRDAWSLERVSTEQIYRMDTQQTGKPRMFARANTSFILWPSPDQQYLVNGTYYGGFAALTADNPTNWLTFNAYDCIFYGCLSEAAAYIKSWEQHEFWEGRFKRAMEVVQNSSDREEHSGSALRQRVAGATP